MNLKSLLLSTTLSILLTSLLFGQTAGDLTVTVTTSSAGGGYSPRNIVAIWIEDDAGNFIKTLLAYAQNRKTHLNTWEASTNAAGSTYNTVDAITGPTKTSHAQRTCYWDATNIMGIIVPDGTYKIWMELTDKNSTGNFSSFSFTKGEEVETLTPFNVPSFGSIIINWIPESTAIPLQTNKNLFHIFPNPTSGEFKLSGNDINNVEISDSFGKLIYSGSSLNLSLKNYPNGVYFVKIISNSKQEIQRIIKK